MGVDTICNVCVWAGGGGGWGPGLVTIVRKGNDENFRNLVVYNVSFFFFFFGEDNQSLVNYYIVYNVKPGNL